MNQISGKKLVCLKKGSSIKNLPISKVESLLKSNFDQNQYTNSAYTKPLNFRYLTQLTCFILLFKIVEMLWSYGKCRKIEVWKIMGRVLNQSLFDPSFSDKIFQTKCCQSLISWRETGY